MTRLICLALAGMLCLTACASRRGPPAPAPIPASDSVQDIRPGDVVRVRIWREPDLSGEYPVNDMGVAVFPKLGDVQATSVTPDALRDTLRAKYDVYLRNPTIEVTVLKRLTILGAVVHAGVFPVDPTMTISDALALAGGSTALGSPTNAYLVRDGSRVPVHLNLTDRVADLPVRSGDEIYVPERSWISRNANVVAASIAAATSIIVALYIRR